MSQEKVILSHIHRHTYTQADTVSEVVAAYSLISCCLFLCVCTHSGTDIFSLRQRSTFIQKELTRDMAFLSRDMLLCGERGFRTSFQKLV
jgi:hypothetical protein